MKEISYRNYNYDSFFEHYYKNDPVNPVGNIPEQILIECKPLLPDYITTIINFGCANGRDFIPFQDHYNCVGFDLAPLGYIDWVCKTDNLTYYQCSIEDYLHGFDHTGLDLSESLVYTQGTLMYLSPQNQTKFISHLLNHNCKNILIHEYPPEYPHNQGYFNPSQELLNIFTRKCFKPDPSKGEGFLYLNK